MGFKYGSDMVQIWFQNHIWLASRDMTCFGGYSLVLQEKGYDRVTIRQACHSIPCYAGLCVFFGVYFGDVTLLLLAVQLFCSFLNRLWFF